MRRRRKPTKEMLALLRRKGIEHAEKVSPGKIELTAPETPEGLHYGIRWYREEAVWKPYCTVHKEYPGGNLRHRNIEAEQYARWQVWTMLHEIGMIEESPPIGPEHVEILDYERSNPTREQDPR